MDAGRFTFEVSFPDGEASHPACSWDECQLLISGYVRAYNGDCGFGLTPTQPNDLASHGKHGVADRTASVDVSSLPAMGTVFSARVITVGESKKRAADCSCGLGASLTHKLWCKLYTDSVIGHTVVFNNN